MRIRLISGDQFLCKLCREVLLGFRDREWDFGMVSSFHQAGSADLLIWDLDLETQLPQNPSFDPRRKSIFLIARKHVAELQNKLPLSGCGIVLKPVNPVLLHALVEEAMAHYVAVTGSKNGQTAEQLRLERDEMLQYLLHANLKLQEYDQDRTTFLAHSVHDLRAPLVAVQGYCGLLLDYQLGPLNPEQVRVLERMQRSVKRLSRLTTAMFQMSVGPQVPRRAPSKRGDIEACVAQAVHELTPVIESKHIKISVGLTPPAEALLLDDIQIEQVLVNLLDNACRFTPRNGFIEIRSCSTFWDRRCPNLTVDVEHADRRASDSSACNGYRVEVRDSGPGVRPEELERIFEEYATDPGTFESSRAGLGLAISRQIIQSHYGQLFAQATGQGAFVFILPYAGGVSRPHGPNIRARFVAAGAVG